MSTFLSFAFLALLSFSCPVLGEIKTEGQSHGSARCCDAVWVSIMARLDEPGGLNYYLDIQCDGRFLLAKSDKYDFKKREIRSGLLAPEVVRRAFRIITNPSVLNARDTDPGEPMFSDSDWVNIGLMTDGKVQRMGGWAFAEEFKDYPVEFRNLINELKAVAETLPINMDVTD
jgi:hypothetical protein